jgi:innexin
MQRTDNMAFVFPTVAKCLLPKFGPSGRQETRDFLCVLPFNLINEKMYIVLWVWFSILAVLTILGVFLRLMQMCFKNLRVILLLFTCHPGHELSVNKVN